MQTPENNTPVLVAKAARFETVLDKKIAEKKYFETTEAE